MSIPYHQVTWTPHLLFASIPVTSLTDHLHLNQAWCTTPAAATRPWLLLALSRSSCCPSIHQICPPPAHLHALLRVAARADEQADEVVGGELLLGDAHLCVCVSMQASMQACVVCKCLRYRSAAYRTTRWGCPPEGYGYTPGNVTAKPATKPIRYCTICSLPTLT